MEKEALDFDLFIVIISFINWHNLLVLIQTIISTRTILLIKYNTIKYSTIQFNTTIHHNTNNKGVAVALKKMSSFIHQMALKA